MAISFRKFLQGLNLIPKTSSTADSKGDLEVISGSGKLQYHDGTSVSPVTTEAHSATLTNKTISGASNTITNIPSSALASGVDATKIADGTVDNTEFQYINSLTSNAQTQLNNKQPLDSTLTSLAAYNTNGLIVQTAADTFAGRTITGTTNQVSVSNGDGVSGNPTLSLPQDINTGATPTFAQVAVAGDPSTSLQVATKQYVDALSNGIKWKQSVLVATTANITLSGEQTIDGVLTSASRVLVKNQSTGSENGIYVSAAGAWSRSADANSAVELTAAAVVVEQGTVNADKGFLQTVDSITLGSTSLTFIQNFGTGLYTADGNGIELSGSTFALELDGSSLSKSASGLKVNITGAPVGTTDSQTLTNKTLTSPTINTPTVDILNWDDQASTPANPSAGFYKTYYKTDGKLYSLNSSGTESQIGAGGSVGLNFIGLTTAFAATNTDDINAEATVGNWATYADAAAASPVDMTGGTATQLTFSRTTTVGELLNGAASFKIVKAAANAQGQGVSVVANVPPGYRGQNALFRMPFKLISGSLVDGDLRLFAYDVTNSIVITPNRNSANASGLLESQFVIPTTCAQLRVGFHFASTSAVAATFSYDDVELVPAIKSTGAIITDAMSFIPTGTWTTNTTYTGFYTRQGDVANFDVTVSTSGAPTSASLRINLPAGLVIDTTKLSSAVIADSAGDSTILGICSVLDSTNNCFFGRVVLNSSSIVAVTMDRTSGTYSDTGPINQAIPITFGADDKVNMKFSVPIVGWSSNITIGNAGTFNISNFLANGSRVTGSAPTAIGQYRSYLRQASAYTYTETNGSPTDTISGANGIRIYSTGNTAGFTSGDVANNPSRYDIFVGKNKNVSFQYYATTGRTGYVDVSYYHLTLSNLRGLQANYDPVTGIATVVQLVTSGSITDTNIGIDLTGNSVAKPYFDIIVSDNALAVGVDSPRSEVYVGTGNGHGSSSTKTRRFSTTFLNVGTAITYADSATLGGTFTINETGIYSVSYTDTRAASLVALGFSVNNSALTTSITSLTYAQGSRGFCHTPGAGFNGFVSRTLNLSAGNIIRFNDDGTADSTTVGETTANVTKVSN